MVDLETMGNGFNAAIIQIGAVAFKPFGDKELVSNLGVETHLGKVHDEFQANISLKSVMKAGFDVDADTIIWWLDQSEEARKVITDPPLRNIGTVYQIKEALSLFRHWVFQIKPQNMWAHKDFDLAILAHTYRKLDEYMPWQYRQTMDLRTINTLLGVPEGLDWDTGRHIAVEDAKRQALMVQKTFQGAGIKEYKIDRAKQ